MEMLNSLRDYSETFLRMLNEMRRRLKELRPENPTAQNYRYESVVASSCLLSPDHFTGLGNGPLEL